MATEESLAGLEVGRTETARLDEAGHGERVGSLVGLLCSILGMGTNECLRWATAAALHDVGKAGVPRAIVDKPGPLDDAEWAIVRSHCEVGHRSLLQVCDLAASMALHHHENWDGTGYPLGLAGEAIPLEGRVVRICDVYDALRSPRPYKPALGHEEALKVMLGLEGRGGASTFDPGLLDLMRRHDRAFASVWDPTR